MLHSPVGDQTFASAGRAQLGTLDSGDYYPTVDAVDGAQARWSVTFRALPSQLTGLRFQPSVARQGTIVTAGYHLSGDARFTATVIDGGGGTVRSLANDLAVSAGDHSLTWDGLTESGAPVRDGSYTLRISGHDANGNALNASTRILLDGTPPSVAVLSRGRIPVRNALVVEVTDRTSGLYAASLTVGHGVVARLSAGSTRLSYRPRRGWHRGSVYRFVVIAVDRAQNRRRYTGSFRAR